MGNRSIFAIFEAGGEGIRAFDTNNNVAVGWFILLDPPEEFDTFSLPISGRDMTKVFVACQSSSPLILGNWERLQRFRGKDPVLDEMIQGCQPLVTEFLEEDETLHASVDLGEYYQLVGDKQFIEFIHAWNRIHHAMDVGDWSSLFRILEEQVIAQWIGREHEGEEKSFHQGVLDYFRRKTSQSPWSVAMCGWENERYVLPPIFMGWGVGVFDLTKVPENMFQSFDEREEPIDPKVREERRRLREQTLIQIAKQREEEALRKRKEPFWLFLWIILFVVLVTVYDMVSVQGYLQWIIGIFFAGILISFMGYMIKLGKIVP